MNNPLHFLLSRFKRQSRVEVKVQVVPSNKIRLSEWQKNQSLTSAMIALERNETYRMAVQLLENEHPRRLIFSPIGISPNDRIVHQAKIEGYELCLNNLAALSKFVKEKKDLQATFEEPEPQQRR